MRDLVKTGLVLSGGGARGAYAVGVVQAIVEILGQGSADPSPFQIFSGTSVGSINAGFLAANAHRGDMAVAKLGQVWTELEVNALLQARGKTAGLRQLSTGWFSNSLLDARPLEQLVRQHLSFEQLHRNVADGHVLAMMVAAFNIRTAQTVIFSELSAGTETRATRDPTRREQLGQLNIGHILASSAMPFVFPACRVGEDYYCDGGLRFNTPISSAIRAGADRLVVISLANHATSDGGGIPEYPSVPFLAGRLLNALLLDPVDYDLEVLERFNRLSRALHEALPPAELARVHAVLTETRGAPYRELDKLVFCPTEDLGRLANEHLREHIASYKLGTLPRYFLKKAATADATWESDWAAYLLFDGRYARKLIDLGRRDTFARRQQVLRFFGQCG
jgi:NTE family protein